MHLAVLGAMVSKNGRNKCSSTNQDQVKKKTHLAARHHRATRGCKRLATSSACARRRGYAPCKPPHACKPLCQNTNTDRPFLPRCFHQLLTTSEVIIRVPLPSGHGPDSQLPLLAQLLQFNSEFRCVFGFQPVDVTTGCLVPEQHDVLTAHPQPRIPSCAEEHPWIWRRRMHGCPTARCCPSVSDCLPFARRRT